MSWDKTNQEVAAKSGQSVTFHYTYTGSKKVSKVRPSCGSCTTASFADNILKCTYTAPVLPPHVTSSTTSAYITVTYADESTTKLTFKAKLG